MISFVFLRVLCGFSEMDGTTKDTKEHEGTRFCIGKQPGESIY